jgi:glycosyltransferase involved in cell wall biosynthesis
MIKISIVIPLYNKKNKVLNTLNSVLNQSYLPDEIIVVNDGSIDGSEQIVKSLNHPLIQLINQDNSGVSVARNKGISIAKNDWIAFLDADDLWDISYLENIINLHKNFPEAKVLATNYKYQLHTGLYKPTIINKINFTPNAFGILNNYFEVASVSNPPIWSSAVVVYKESIQNIGGFPIGIKSGEDLITWAKLAIENQIAYSIKPLGTFVLDPAHSYQDIPNRIPDTQDFVSLELQKLNKSYPNAIGLNLYTAHWHKMRASIYLRLGERKLCFKEIKKSLSFSIYQPILFLYLIFLIIPTFVVNSIFRLKN